ncbi:hypothetical protein KIN20_007765 [Parelaphostrongylus tenuis]|uniref:RRM domain-containing protein n=1 Tax=Parelaphostrongylus tenuis TaxID=148309 RepID=A0AAD5QK78_PARTN|nr:hypothetical protein KIN20_007765 [Parelaphostrongylus tenuis]
MSEVSDRTCYVCNLSPRVTSDIIEELFVQMGPVEGVRLFERNSNRFAFVYFEDDVSVPFAVEMLDGIRLYGVSITVEPQRDSKHNLGRQRSNDNHRDTRENRSDYYHDNRESCPSTASSSAQLGTSEPLHPKPE